MADTRASVAVYLKSRQTLDFLFLTSISKPRFTYRFLRVRDKAAS